MSASVPSPSATAPSATERAQQVRRNTFLLVGVQAVSQVSLSLLLLVGGPGVAALSGSVTIQGVFLAMYFAAAAIGAARTGRWMDSVGRKPGLVLGAVLVTVGALLGAAGGWTRVWLLLVIAAIPYGAGAGALMLSRVAVADMYPAQRRARVVGFVLAAGTIGAVGGAPLVAFIQDRSGSASLVIPWILVPIFMGFALLLLRMVKPDPRDLAVVEPEAEDEAAGEHRTPRVLFRREAPYRAALISAAVGQVAMVGVMGVTPTVIHQHGHGNFAVSATISIHVVGMFLFAPFLGMAFDRFGRKPGLLGGAVVSAAGALLAGSSENGTMLAIGLFLVGLGWSSAFLASTTVVSDITTPGERGGALGFMDLFVSLASATGVLASGALFDIAGFSTVTVVMSAVVALGLVFAFRLREPAPGQWQHRTPLG